MVGRLCFPFRRFLPLRREEQRGRWTPFFRHTPRSAHNLSTSVVLSYRPKCFFDSHIGRLQHEDFGVLVKMEDGEADEPSGPEKKEWYEVGLDRDARDEGVGRCFFFFFLCSLADV